MSRTGVNCGGFLAPLGEPRAVGGSVLIHLVLLAVYVGLGRLAVVAPGGGGAWGRAPIVAEVERGAIEPRIVAVEEGDGDGAEGQGAPGRGGGGAPGGGGGTGGVGEAEGGAGGSGGGGNGVGTTYFEGVETARSIVYVIDRSGSMAERRRLASAKAELLSSVARLGEGARFAVIFYNHEMAPFEGAREPLWLEANAANRARLAEWLERIDARGGTIPRPVLEAALRLRPEVVYVVTDGQELTAGEVEALAEAARSSATRFHTIDLGATGEQGPGAPLRRLAETTGGSYRQVGR